MRHGRFGVSIGWCEILLAVVSFVVAVWLYSMTSACEDTLSEYLWVRAAAVSAALPLAEHYFRPVGRAIDWFYRRWPGVFPLIGQCLQSRTGKLAGFVMAFAVMMLTIAAAMNLNQFSFGVYDPDGLVTPPVHQGFPISGNATWNADCHWVAAVYRGQQLAIAEIPRDGHWVLPHIVISHAQDEQDLMLQIELRRDQNNNPSISYRRLSVTRHLRLSPQTELGND